MEKTTCVMTPMLNVLFNLEKQSKVANVKMTTLAMTVVVKQVSRVVCELNIQVLIIDKGNSIVILPILY